MTGSVRSKPAPPARATASAPLALGVSRIGLGIAVAVLVLSALAELGIHRHGYLGFDEIFAFHGWFGLLAGLAAVVVARGLVLTLGRPAPPPAAETDDDD
ncbi:hypothetical protein GCM10011505_44450 [Tistrella bauzanensis]|uniref:Uncharacterized protein n=1 Tax=Tistrella bauzanensis TaxID=657419 RepID=A0ABQ1J635_9PROT|nr:hypothetical protein [Tistrella bauzanensis]GGB58736.1 hypothetical protein GCM10011505_44450 [Tistrella bauzanensis]